MDRRSDRGFPWRGLLWRLAIGAVLVAGLYWLPLPSGWDPQGTVREGILAWLVVVWLGKTLYDTLFHDRYWP
jgi:hypothetical protein